MSLIVTKFGGSSVADAERINRVANIICSLSRGGNEVVAVVSAQGDTTDELIEKAKQISPRPGSREMDMLLATGEQASAALMAMAVERQGCRAVSLSGPQAGFLTSSRHGIARIRSIDATRINTELENNNVVIVAGFQGAEPGGDITTLGRGGSDTSAVALAAALGADVCKIYTDVDGVFTADPRKVKNARKLDSITYDEMLEMATLGAQVLLNRAVELGKKYNVPIEVLSSATGKPGTMVREVNDVEGMVIRGVAKDADVAAISVLGVPDVPGVAFNIISLLAAKKIHVDLILQSTGSDGRQDFSFTVPRDMRDTARELLQNNIEVCKGRDVHINDDVAKVSVVGTGMQSHTGVAAKMFEALYRAGINILMITTSEIKISVLIGREDADRAVAAVHEAFFEK